MGGVFSIRHPRVSLLRLTKGPAGVSIAASGPAFVDGLGHLVEKADRAL
jgi:hypothetical protein